METHFKVNLKDWRDRGLNLLPLVWKACMLTGLSLELSDRDKLSHILGVFI